MYTLYLFRVLWWRCRTLSAPLRVLHAFSVFSWVSARFPDFLNLPKNMLVDKVSPQKLPLGINECYFCKAAL